MRVRLPVFWLVSGLALVGLTCFLVYLSPSFDYERFLDPASVFLLTGSSILSGLIYLWVVRRVRKAQDLTVLGGKRFSSRGEALMIWIIATGIILRLLFIISTPMCEDDHYRYLWDGAVWLHGYNPYGIVPKDVQDGIYSTHGGPEEVRLRLLAQESGNVIKRVNHPHLRTVYPPVAQIAFAFAYILKAWSLPAWRLVLLLCDVILLFLLIFILQDLGLPLLYTAIYWLNPLLIKEIYNSGHMDILISPFLLGALFLLSRKRFIWSTVLLALGVAVKVWPVVLFPLIIRQAAAHSRRPLIMVPGIIVVFAVLIGFMMAPIIQAGVDANMGFIAYGKTWQMNDSLFMIVGWGVGSCLKILGMDGSHQQLATRCLCGVILLLAVFLVIRHRADKEEEYYHKALIITAALFILSPTQFPWYSLWFLPLLAISPSWPLLLYTALLPLYYLRFYFDLIGHVGLFDYGVVWFQHVPVWIWLFVNWRRARIERAR